MKSVGDTAATSKSSSDRIVKKVSQNENDEQKKLASASAAHLSHSDQPANDVNPKHQDLMPKKHQTGKFVIETPTIARQPDVEKKLDVEEETSMQIQRRMTDEGSKVKDPPITSNLPNTAHAPESYAPELAQTPSKTDTQQDADPNSIKGAPSVALKENIVISNLAKSKIQTEDRNEADVKNANSQATNLNSLTSEGARLPHDVQTIIEERTNIRGLRPDFDLDPKIQSIPDEVRTDTVTPSGDTVPVKQAKKAEKEITEGKKQSSAVEERKLFSNSPNPKPVSRLEGVRCEGKPNRKQLDRGQGLAILQPRESKSSGKLSYDRCMIPLRKK